MVNNSSGRGDTIQYDTASTTSEFDTGLIACHSSTTAGTVVYGTENPAGVTATKVASRTTATSEEIVVQTSGLAAITCAANEAFSHGDFVGSGTEGLATTLATVGTAFTEAGLKQMVGRAVVPDATTEGTTVVVNLGVGLC